jgi:precorrin-2 dehydrogenase/sirohydrochlorin ferrochelatase
MKVNKRIFDLCRKRYLICNIADTYVIIICGIVTKGNVKIAISTNGNHPAKRLREFFEEVIPEDINKMVENLNEYRKP